MATKRVRSLLYRIKNMKKLTFIIIVISIGFSQIKSPKQGGGLNVGDRGAGIFYHRNIPPRNANVAETGSSCVGCCCCW